MYTETNQLLREFLGTDEIRVVIPFIYELGEELPTSNNEATLDNVIDEVRLELEEGIINSVDANIELKDFHNSWDLLMKVVDKIEDTNIDGNFFNVTIGNGNFCVIQDSHGELVEINVDASSKILTVYKSCVEFVKWNNNLNL